MASKPKLLVHAGADKCGSTSAQASLRQNAQILNALGYSVRIADPTFYNYFAANSGDADAASAYLREAAHGRNLVLSGEGLSSVATLEQFAKRPLFRDWETHIVLFVRPQDQWFEAAWWQWFAYNSPRRTVAEAIDVAIASNRCNWAWQASTWKSVAGVESVTVVPITHRDPVTFLMEDSFGLSDYRRPQRRNERIPQTVHALMHQNPVLKPTAHDNTFLRDLRQATRAELGAMRPTPPVLSRAEIETLDKRVFPGNAELYDDIPDGMRHAFATDPQWAASSTHAFRDPSYSRPEPVVDENELRQLLGLARRPD